MVEDKHLIKCLRFSSRNEYLTLTSMECLIPHKHTLKISYKSKHFPLRYRRKREWVFFFLNTVEAAAAPKGKTLWAQGLASLFTLNGIGTSYQRT